MAAKRGDPEDYHVPAHENCVLEDVGVVVSWRDNKAKASSIKSAAIHYAMWTEKSEAVNEVDNSFTSSRSRLSERKLVDSELDSRRKTTRMRRDFGTFRNAQQ
jgi:hypothetical protein